VQKLVAVIDDELEMEDLYRFLLEDLIDHGLVSLIFFSDSRDFVKWIRHNGPDLILTDINMPYLNGTDLLNVVKETGREIPVYFVSGHDERDFKQIMDDLGVCRFVPKPLDLEMVLGVIELDLGLGPAKM
jgi:DNA-binding NtrC family response regulator